MNSYNNFRKTAMLLLAFDTSDRRASIALCSESEVYGEYIWSIGRNHSVELLDRIQRLLAECGVAMSQIDGIAVAMGPGSFNGVRVALATAKTLAFVLQKPLWGISTLDIIAAGQQQATQPLCAVMEAGRSELYAACYTTMMYARGDVHYMVTRQGEYGVFAPAQLAEFVQAQLGTNVSGEQTPILFCGEISDPTRQAITAELPGRCLFLSNVQSTRRASVLAILALQQWREGKVDDPLLLEPLYLRRPSITTSTKKRPLLGITSQRPTGQSSTEREEGAVRH